MTHLTRVTLPCAGDCPPPCLRCGPPMHAGCNDGWFRPGSLLSGRVVRQGSGCMTHLTGVTLACAGDGPAVCLRFGRPMHEDDPDGRCRRVYFRAGAVFARMQCPAPGRQQLAVLRAAGPGERIQCIARIEPGAQLLLHATTTARTELALQAIAAIETQRIAPDEVSEDYWRVLHQRLVAGVEAPPYTAAEHAAVTLRRAWPA